jgi:hypothetical protein
MRYVHLASLRRSKVAVVCLVVVAAALVLATPTLRAAVRTFFPAATVARGDGDVFRGVVNVYCTPRGFEDEEIDLPAGRYVLAVRNASGIDNLSFSIGTSGTSPLAAGTARAGTSFNTTVILEPGTLTITEASHPLWQCQINVEP